MADWSDIDALALATPADEYGPLLRRWTMRELAAEPFDFAWLVRGLLASPTFGQVAGEMKTLKSYVTGFIQVGLSGGLPVFGQFTPEHAMPVVAYVGEGGRRLWTRRTLRICSAMGVEDPDDLDLHPVFDVAPIESIEFQESLRRDLDEIGPGLVTVDPLYAYHGKTTRASDLHQEGALLNQLSGLCVDAGASLLIVNHFNQTGNGINLRRITMAGSGEWSDSWLLVAHRRDPDVGAGSFKLALEVGSRQWGGSEWELDLDIGRFDEETGTHDGKITWGLRKATSSSGERRSAAVLAIQRKIQDALASAPWTLTKTQLKAKTAGSSDLFQEAFAQLVEQREIESHKCKRIEGGASKTRIVWGLASTHSGEARTGSDAEGD